MKQEYEAESQNLQVQLDEKRATSADYDNEIAYAQQQATDLMQTFLQSRLQSFRD